MSIIHTTSNALADTASLITRFNAIKAPVTKCISKLNARLNSRAGLKADCEAEYDRRCEALRATGAWIAQCEFAEAAEIAYRTGTYALARAKNRSLIKRSGTSLSRYDKALFLLSNDAQYAIDKIDHELERVGNWAYPALTAEDHNALRAFRADIVNLQSDIAALRATVRASERQTWAYSEDA